MVVWPMRVTAVSTKVFFLCLFLALIGELVTLAVSYHTAYPYLPVLGIERLLLAILLLVIAGPGSGRGVPFGLGRERLTAGLKRGLIWSVFTGLAALFFFAVLYAAHISPLSVIRTPLPTDAMKLTLFFLVGGLIGPVAEEIFFRGIVYGFLRRWGVVLALLGTSIVFVAAHLSNTALPLPQIVGGLIFAIAYEVEGSLLVPIIIHVLGNTAIFALCLVGARLG
jgi:membrane protease YdiL (CAAX protease family)